jgi:hypothetical protein
VTLSPAQSTSLSPASSREESGGGSTPADEISTIGPIAATSSGTLVTPGAANVKGSWVQLSAAAPFEVAGLGLDVQAITAGDYLIDIGIGAAAAETVLVADILLSTVGIAEGFNHQFIPLPIGITVGTRVAARAQCSTGANVLPVVLALYGAGPAAAVSSYTAGAVAADSGGTTIDPGAVLNTKGAWAELIAATTGIARYVVLLLGGRGNGARVNANWLIDIGIGAAGSEVVVVPDLLASQTATQDIVRPCVFPMPLEIPSGSRVAVRAQANTTDATDRLFDATLTAFVF